MVNPLYCVSTYSKTHDIISDVKKDDSSCTKGNIDNLVNLKQ